MREWKKAGGAFVLLFLATLWFATPVHGAEAEDLPIKKGIYAGDIDLSGMTAGQATESIEAYVEELRQTSVTLLAAAETEVTVTAGELGVQWVNQSLVEEAVSVGTRGNVIERYRVLKDLEQENLVYPIELEFDQQAISDVLVEKCEPYNMEAVNATLTRENGQFKVVGGQTGYTLDVELSIDTVYEYLTQQWDHQACTIPLQVQVEEPKGNPDELAQVQDVLGTFTTNFRTSTPSRCVNIEVGCNFINGTTLYPGEEFSTCDVVTPFSRANGYQMAGSYLNGKVVDSLGGGICQVSTTLYNAVLLSELEVTERHNHSMIVSYVDPSADAAIAESSGKDFKFINNLEYPIYIEGYTEGKDVTFTIYGKDTRKEGYQVRYDSEVLEVSVPPTDNISADASQPLGYITTASAHVGYKARLWKVVLQDGVEISRTQVNSSSYKMVPRSATVGVSTPDPAAYEQIMAAIGTGSIDHVKNVIAMLTAPPPAPETPPEGQ